MNVDDRIQLQPFRMLVTGAWVVWNGFAGPLCICTLTTSFGDPDLELRTGPRIL